MSNNSTYALDVISSKEIMVAYHSLAVTVLGTIFNLLTFIILCRPTFRNNKIRPTLHYMRAMAIFDILMLYGMNFDHFLAGAFEFTIQTRSIPLCRFLSFFNYFVPQASAWLRVFVCMDRYLSLSRTRMGQLSRPTMILINIACTLIVLASVNSIFFVYGCSLNKQGSIRRQSWAFKIYPLWNYVHLGVYNALPFLLMSLFNCGIIYHVYQLRQRTLVRNRRIQRLAISVTLVITTVLFLIMTIPANVIFAFFSSRVDVLLRRFLDGVSYTYHIISFPLYMITFDEFRRECLSMIKCSAQHRRVAP